MRMMLLLQPPPLLVVLFKAIKEGCEGAAEWLRPSGAMIWRDRRG